MTILSKTRQLTTRLFLLTLLLSAGMAWAQSGNILSDSFGMQCGQSSDNCLATQSGITLPPGPGLLRLWDSKVNWSFLNTGSGTYNWSTLDAYLDAIAAEPTPPAVVYTFGWVPCWDVPIPCMTGGPNAPDGTSTPPEDLGNGICGTGSCTFETFVQVLTTHCSKNNNNCVGKCTVLGGCGNGKPNLIKYYEMWNEANDTTYWNPSPGTNTFQPLYQMVEPVVTTIKNNVTGAKILTPSVNTSNQFSVWQTGWLGLEDDFTRISDIYNFHAYLGNSAPEDQYKKVVSTMLKARNNDQKWETTPWWNDETNFNGSDETCDTTQFSSQDCTGQIARWQLLHASNSGTNLSTNVSWYQWKSTMAENSPDYGNAYRFIMQYLLNGSFTAPCSFDKATNYTWTCAFTEASGQSALFVWSTSEEIGQTFSLPVPNHYADYRDLQGNTTNITNGELTVPITVEPIMLETPIKQ
jgi:hypothetical protein